MAKQFERLGPAQAAFIAAQRIFFTVSAPPTGRMDVSPRGINGFPARDAALPWEAA